MRRQPTWRQVLPVFMALVVSGVLHDTRFLILANAAEPEPARPHTRLQGRAFERDVAQFLERFQQFLDCCAADHASLQQVKALEEQASALLGQAQTGVASELAKLRGFTVHEIVAPVKKVRDDLRAIGERLERIQEARDRLEEKEDLDFFTFWTERRKIRDALEAITREFRPPRRPTGPPTGPEIGVTPPVGPEIGTVPPTGSGIGTVPPTGREIGTTPPTGKGIGVTPPTGPAIGGSPPR